MRTGVMSVLLAAVLICSMAVFSGCTDRETNSGDYLDNVNLNGHDYFEAVVVEVRENSVLVECTDCPSGVMSAGSQAVFSTKTVEKADEMPELHAGQNILVVFSGEVMETYPLQIGTVFAVYQLDQIYCS